MTIKEIAEKIGVSQQKLNYGINKGILDIEEYSKILQLLEIPSFWFISPTFVTADYEQIYVNTNREIFKKFPEYRSILEKNDIYIYGIVKDEIKKETSNSNDSTSYLLKLVIEDHEKRIAELEQKLKHK